MADNELQLRRALANVEKNFRYFKERYQKAKSQTASPSAGMLEKEIMDEFARHAKLLKALIAASGTKVYEAKQFGQLRENLKTVRETVDKRIRA